MTIQNFEQPISIFIGLGFPFEVVTPSQAYEILNDWSGVRGETHAQALSLCRLATIGEAEIAIAKTAFEAFAHSRGILAEEALAEAVRRASEEWMAA